MTPLPDFLEWLADRLVHVYGESPNVDFVLALRRHAAEQRRPAGEKTFCGFTVVVDETVPPNTIKFVMEQGHG